MHRFGRRYRATWNGNNLTQDAYANSAGSKAYIYSLTNATGGTGSIVIPFSNTSTDGKAVTATKVSGLATSSMFDQLSTATGSSTTPASGSTPTTTQADELIFGCIGTNGPNGDTAVTWESFLSGGQRLGSTGGGATSNSTASDGYRIVSSTGAYSSSKTGITSRSWSAAVATYKAAVSTGCQTYGTCSSEAQLGYTSGAGYRWCMGTHWNQIKVTP